MEKTICLPGCRAERSHVVRGSAPQSRDLGAQSSLPTRRVTVKMSLLIYVDISLAGYAGNESKKGFFDSLLYTIKMNTYVLGE